MFLKNNKIIIPKTVFQKSKTDFHLRFKNLKTIFATKIVFFTRVSKYLLPRNIHLQIPCQFFFLIFFENRFAEVAIYPFANPLPGFVLIFLENRFAEVAVPKNCQTDFDFWNIVFEKVFRALENRKIFFICKSQKLFWKSKRRFSKQQFSKTKNCLKFFESQFLEKILFLQSKTNFQFPENQKRF